MAGTKRFGFSSLESRGQQQSNTNTNDKRSNSFINLGMKRDGIMTFGRSLTSGVTRAVFREDLNKVSSGKKILDPQDKGLVRWNRLLLQSCIFAIYVDPLFLYLPVLNTDPPCFRIHNGLAIAFTIARTVLDAFYLTRISLQFRTAYIAPSSRVFGRGELVIDHAQIAHRYLRRYFVVDLLSVLPIPQVLVWRYLGKSSYGIEVIHTKRVLFFVLFFQGIPRLWRCHPISTELKKSASVSAETAWAGAAYYLLLFMLAGHVYGSLWYLLSVERKQTCWKQACGKSNGTCVEEYLYCGFQLNKKWEKMAKNYLNQSCFTDGDGNQNFPYGIFAESISAGLLEDVSFVPKYFYCLWWGLMNLSTLGQGLTTSTYTVEVLFSIFVAISGLILFALLIGNMQTYLQSLTIRLEEMRIKRRDSERWMHHRLLPQELRESVRRYDRYKWVETRGVDEEALVQNLPKYLRRDIKRHLCLSLVRRVPLFAKMDERLLDAICERLKPGLYTENTYVLREGDPVNEMLFVIRGRLESVTTDGGRSGFFNRSFLKGGDFCGEELLTWALDPKSGSNLPPSTRTVKALTELEAFALIADELKFITSQFRRLHSRQVQHTFRFYSQQWRTWAASFIQAFWRRYSRRKYAELFPNEQPDDSSSDEEEDDEHEKCELISNTTSSSFGTAMLASRFAAHALRGLHRRRGKGRLQKPPEPDFTDDAT